MKPRGAIVTLSAYWWESGKRPVEGDFLRTSTGRCYRIDHIKVRQQGPETYVARLRCTVLGRDAVEDGAPGVWRWCWGRSART